MKDNAILYGRTGPVCTLWILIKIYWKFDHQRLLRFPTGSVLNDPCCTCAGIDLGSLNKGCSLRYLRAGCLNDDVWDIS